jgi:hypothetical protein
LALSTSLSNLLRAAYLFATDTISKSLVENEMAKTDRDLKSEILQVVDHYGLRNPDPVPL